MNTSTRFTARCIAPMLLVITFGVHAQSTAASSADVPLDLGTVSATYRFRITRGAELAVCDAYLRRLRATTFRRPPQCEIPENDRVPGFAKLNRVSLSTNEIAKLWPRIFSFETSLRQTDDTPGWPVADAIRRIGSSLFAWRYDPPISVENNGKQDNIEVWQGAGGSSGPCGEVATVGNANAEVMVQVEQVPFVMTQDGTRIDENRTKLLFGHPKGDIVVTQEYGPLRPRGYGFRPIGGEIGFFEFRGTVYFETFYSGWTGDYQGKRIYGGKGDIRSLSNTLAVFLRKDDTLRQVCEYQMRRTCNEGSCPPWL